MLDDQDRLHLLAQRPDQLDELPELGFDQARADLVQQQDPRPHGQCAGEFQALEAQQAEVGRRAVSELEQPAAGQDPLTFGPRRAAPGLGAMHLGDQQILHHGHLAERPRNLVRAADTAARPQLGARAGHVLAEQLDPALSGNRAGQQADEGALTGPVRADHAEHLTAAQFEVDMVDRAHAAVDLAHAGGPQQRCPRLARSPPRVRVTRAGRAGRPVATRQRGHRGQHLPRCVPGSTCSRRGQHLPRSRCPRRGQHGAGLPGTRPAGSFLAEPAPAGPGQLARGTPQPVRGQPDDEDEQDAENRQVDLGIVREALGQPDRDGGADQRADHRADPPDDGGVHGLDRPVQGERPAGLDIAGSLRLYRADDAHDERGDHERGELGAERQHADALRHVLVVPDRPQPEPEAAADEPRHGERDPDRHREREQVDRLSAGRRIGQRDALVPAEPVVVGHEDAECLG